MLFQLCQKAFKAKRSLQYHQFMMHGMEQQQSQDDSSKSDRNNNNSEAGDGEDSSPPQPSSAASMAAAAAFSSMFPNRGSPENTPTAPPPPFYSKLLQFSQSPLFLSSGFPSLLGAASAVATATSSTPPSSVTTTTTSPSAAAASSGPLLTPDGLACNYCGKVCPRPSILKRHMMMHTGERPFQCKVHVSLHIQLFSFHFLVSKLS